MAKKPKGTEEKVASRMGRFELPLDVINDSPELVRRVMGECIVMRAEFVFGTQSVIYDAIVEDFEPRVEGTTLVAYDPVYDSEKDLLTWQKSPVT